MWELIAENQRKSMMLIIGMALSLFALGYVLGELVTPGGWVMGMTGAGILWGVMSTTAFFGGDKIFLAVAGAQEVSHELQPQLHNIVEEMRIAANLPVAPKVYVMYQKAPNAFATGMSPENSAIVVTTGLLETLNRDELQGVIAHEMSHILNRDVRFMTLAGVILGSVTLLSEGFLRGMRYSGRSRYSSRNGNGGGQAQAILLIAAIVLAILAPLLARIFYFAISRKREYLADASGVRLTRYPEGLASALEKIAHSSEPLPAANKITSPLYIVPPLQFAGENLTRLMSTHPPTEERIRILRNMTFGSGFVSYDKAYQMVSGRKQHIVPGSGLKETYAGEIRSPSTDQKPVLDTQIAPRLGDDLLRAAQNFIFLTCTCGLRVKLPPELKEKSIDCPRCHHSLQLPAAEMVAAGAMLQTATQAIAKPETLSYTRKTQGWESVQCFCGQLLQISPLFKGTNLRCSKCGRSIRIQ